MSERKVLNKYYPPDFDPTKLPKLKRDRNRQFVIRIMAPFSMRCNTCGEYIYKGRKFNSRMETVENETYLGLRIYRFYIRCTKCITEITFKTDPENTDYTMEHGATRNFEAHRKLSEQVEKAKKDKEEEEANNPMKALENRTKDSKKEMESLEKLEELKDLTQRAAKIDPEKLIEDHLKIQQEELTKQEMDDEELIKKVFGSGGNFTSGHGYLRRIIDSDSDSDTEKPGSSKKSRKEEELFEEATSFISADDMPGPAIPQPKKSKLKTPFDDLSSMIRLKKTEKSDEEVKVVVKKTKEKQEEPKPSEPEVPSLPAYKINLKKPENKNEKMKGTSLSLLGGYNSSDTSSEDD